jgi:adenosylcobinamide-phosphate synthase
VSVDNLWQSGPALALTALIIEAIFGYPKRLFGWIGHPVTWIGALIGTLEQATNRETFSPWMRATLGALTALIVIGLSGAIALGTSHALPNSWWGFAIEALLASSLIASRSLYDHVGAVARPLALGDLEGARHAVSQIIGRDTRALDEAGIARGAIESLAENSSDGVIAPLFWCALLGLPGLVAYKAINTLDSMIAHRSPRYESFGGFAARGDDLANWLPARLSGVLLAIVSLQIILVMNQMLADARHHRSLNAGWPEAAMATSLGIRLSGPRTYGGQIHDEPWLNAGGADPSGQSITGGLKLFVRMIALMGVFLALLSLVALNG